MNSGQPPQTFFAVGGVDLRVFNCQTDLVQPDLRTISKHGTVSVGSFFNT